MHDAGISNQQLTNKQLELIFCSENKHRSNMGFQPFLETFPKILKIKYPTLFQRNPGQAFSKLLTEHLIPLYTAWE